MTLRGRVGINKQDITGTLNLAVQVLTTSHVPQRLQKQLQDAKPGVGRPSHLPQYTALAVLGTWFQLLYANQPPSAANILNCLWFDYTPAQLAILGLPADWRDPVRAERMKDKAVYRQEYDRLHDFMTDLLTPIDDTPIQAVKNVTNGELRTARAETADTLAPRTALADEYSNDILAATVTDAPLFAGYRSALSTDLHAVGITPSRKKKPTADGTVKPGPPIADFYPRHRRLGTSYCVGLTLALAVNDPDKPRIPDVALGMGLSHPTSATMDAALTAIKAADRHPFTRSTGSNHPRWVIGDNAYTHSTTFNADLHTLGRSLLMEHSDRATGEHNNRRTIKWVYALRTRAMPQDIAGPHLIPGAIICPALSGNVLREERIWQHDTHDEMTDEQLAARKKRLDLYEALRMPTDGKPRRVSSRGMGRPRKDAPAGEDVYRVEVFCPARCGKVRCTRYEPSLQLRDKPYVDPPPDSLSWVCQAENPSAPDKPAATTIDLTQSQFKLWGPLMAGTFKHRDLLKHARAHNEGFHNYIVAPEHANLDDRTLRGRRSSVIRMTITLAVAIANIRSIDAFAEARRCNGGQNPEGNRANIINARRKALTA